MDEVDKKISLISGGNQFYFPAAGITYTLEKDTIIFKLPSRRFARDLLRVKKTFTIDGFWHDDPDSLYDGKTSADRKARIVTIARNKRVNCYLFWNDVSFTTMIKSTKFSKISGQGDAIKYNIVLVEVTR